MALEVTMLATATAGAAASDRIDLATTALATAWNDGTYKGVVVGFSYDAGFGEFQSAAFMPKVRDIPAGDTLEAIFAIAFLTGVVKGNLRIGDTGARVSFDDNSIPANAVVTLYGVN